MASYAGAVLGEELRGAKLVERGALQPPPPKFRIISQQTILGEIGSLSGKLSI